MPIGRNLQSQQFDATVMVPKVRQRSRPPVPAGHAATPVTDESAEAETIGSELREYEVGYGKPPVATRFKAGQSGNPRGRPKAAKGLRTIVRETLTEKVAVRTGAGAKKISRMEAVLHKTLELAMKGNTRALLQLTALYASAVPDSAPITAAPVPDEELTATDVAVLEELKASWLAETAIGR